MSWIDDEIKEKKEKEDREKAARLKKDMEENNEKKMKESLYRTEILPFKGLIEKSVNEANEELVKVGLKAVISDMPNCLSISAEGYDKRSLFFSITKRNDRYYVALHNFYFQGGLTEDLSTLYDVRLDKICKLDIITMIGIITNKVETVISKGNRYIRHKSLYELLVVSGI